MLTNLQLDYLQLVNDLLLKNYAIDFIDTGYDELEWILRFGEQTAEVAVHQYAEKYELTLVDDALVSTPTKQPTAVGF